MWFIFGEKDDKWDNGPTFIPLECESSIDFGRKSGPMLRTEDKGVSKVQFRLAVGECDPRNLALNGTGVPQYPRVSVEDLSRKSTFLNGAVVPPDERRYAVAPVNELLIGKFQCSMLIIHVSVVFLLDESVLGVAGVAQVVELAKKIGAKIAPEWSPACTHVVSAPTSSASPLFTLARVKGMSVVSLDWINQLAGSVAAVYPYTHATPQEEIQVWMKPADIRAATAPLAHSRILASHTIVLTPDAVAAIGESQVPVFGQVLRHFGGSDPVMATSATAPTGVPIHVGTTSTCSVPSATRYTTLSAFLDGLLANQVTSTVVRGGLGATQGTAAGSAPRLAPRPAGITTPGATPIASSSAFGSVLDDIFHNAMSGSARPAATQARGSSLAPRRATQAQPSAGTGTGALFALGDLFSRASASASSSLRPENSLRQQGSQPPRPGTRETSRASTATGQTGAGTARPGTTRTRAAPISSLYGTEVRLEQLGIPQPAAPAAPPAPAPEPTSAATPAPSTSSSQIPAPNDVESAGATEGEPAAATGAAGSASQARATIPSPEPEPDSAAATPAPSAPAPSEESQAIDPDVDPETLSGLLRVSYVKLVVDPATSTTTACRPGYVNAYPASQAAAAGSAGVSSQDGGSATLDSSQRWAGRRNFKRFRKSQAPNPLLKVILPLGLIANVPINGGGSDSDEDELGSAARRRRREQAAAAAAAAAALGGEEVDELEDDMGDALVRRGSSGRSTTKLVPFQPTDSYYLKPSEAVSKRKRFALIDGDTDPESDDDDQLHGFGLGAPRSSTLGSNGSAGNSRGNSQSDLRAGNAGGLGGRSGRLAGLTGGTRPMRRRGQQLGSDSEDDGPISRPSRKLGAGGNLLIGLGGGLGGRGGQGTHLPLAPTGSLAAYLIPQPPTSLSAGMPGLSTTTGSATTGPHPSSGVAARSGGPSSVTSSHLLSSSGPPAASSPDQPPPLKRRRRRIGSDDDD
ncbi:hypothetical protein H9P43_003780 [Blastocladiella emersonii ATCC 22665]|nr:hypothetical protein H9P43_003780 [Blastocladiella emersonii ATCC 22665]